MKINGQYLTFEEYKTLGGTLSQVPFEILEFEVRRKIDERTFGRLKGVEQLPPEVKMCENAMMNSILKYSSENNEKINGNIASESIDGYSVSYITGSQIQEIIKSKDYELEDIMMTYLTGVVVNNEHILYLGIS